MKIRSIIVGAFALSLIGSTPLVQSAFAFEKGACREDVQKLCPDAKGPAKHDCLKQHEAELSPGCQHNMTEMKEHHQGMLEKMKKVEEVCKADIQKFCSTVKQGEGRIFHCLKAYEPDLSSACQQELKQHKGMGHHHEEKPVPPASK